MKKVLSGLLASSLILSMGTVSYASTMEDRLDNIFGMIELAQGDTEAEQDSAPEVELDSAPEEVPEVNLDSAPEAEPEVELDSAPEEEPEVNLDSAPEETPEEAPQWEYLPDNDPSPKTAEPSTARVMVNGEEVPFAAYTIEGFNYFKLTDVSYALTGTSRQFEVTWDETVGAINMVTERPHLVLGTELQGNSGQAETALRFFSPVYKNGEEMVVTVYTISGSSYFKLDSLMVALDLNVGWNGETGTITIDA